ncbi:hypothetical protein NQZ79_g4978 [Umbelopsis isabellina]|nr:hypothetical protein NQZ79_g4978 [Umbelopsis isabellina]
MTKKHLKPNAGQHDPNELDPPPPYSPQELPGSSQPGQAPGIQPSAPTAEDVNYDSLESQAMNEYDDNASSGPVAQQGGVTNYGSIGNQTITGDVQPQNNRQVNYWRSQGDQQREQATQQREQAARQREQAERQREQSIYQSARTGQAAEQERNQTEQPRSYSKLFRKTGDVVGSQADGISVRISKFRNGAKHFYSSIPQSETGEPSDTQDDGRMLRRHTKRKSLCVFLIITFILIFFGFALYFLLDNTSKTDPSPTPQPPARSSSSSVSHPPSKTTSKGHSGPSSPMTTSTIPVPTGIPSDIPKIPGDPPKDGTSCGPGCTISSYTWPIDDDITAFRLIATGALTSGNVLVQRSANSGPGYVSLVFELKGVEKKDIEFFVGNDDGMTVYLSTPSSLSIWSSLNVRVVIALPEIDEKVFQIFQCIMKQAKIVLSDVNGSFTIPKLDIIGANGKIEISPLFITTDSQLIQTTNDDIIGSTKALAGKSQVVTTNGDIRLNGIGAYLDIEGRNTNIEGAFNCSTKCLFKTSNGRVAIAQIDTPNIVIDNQNGALDIRRASSVVNIVASTSNAAVRFEAVSFKKDPTILLVGRNGLIDCIMPMEYEGSFVAETSKGQSVTVKIVNPIKGHGLKLKVGTGNYASGTKFAPSGSSQGSLQASTKNADIDIQFV